MFCLHSQVGKCFYKNKEEALTAGFLQIFIWFISVLEWGWTQPCDSFKNNLLSQSWCLTFNLGAPTIWTRAFKWQIQSSRFWVSCIWVHRRELTGLFEDTCMLLNMQCSSQWTLSQIDFDEVLLLHGISKHPAALCPQYWVLKIWM